MYQGQLFITDDESAPLSILRLKIRETDQAHHFLVKTWRKNKLDRVQGFKMLFLDNACEVIGFKELFFTASRISHLDTRKLMTIAEKMQAHHLILAQNKPYGVVLPTVSDLNFAELLMEAGKDNDIPLLDYLFINQQGYYSCAANEFHVCGKPQPC